MLLLDVAFDTMADSNEAFEAVTAFLVRLDIKTWCCARMVFKNGATSEWFAFSPRSNFDMLGHHVGAGKVNIKTASDSRLVTHRKHPLCSARDLLSRTNLVALFVVPGPFSGCHLIAVDFTAFKNSNTACKLAHFANRVPIRACLRAVFEDIDEVSKCQGSPSQKKTDAPGGHL